MPRYVTVEAPPRAPLAAAEGYRVGEFVEVAGRKGDAAVTYVAEITALWAMGDGHGFTGKFYYFPADLDDKTMAQFPSHPGNHISSARDTDIVALKTEDNEIFASPFSGDLPLRVIIKRCNVVQSMPLRQFKDEPLRTYLCRYAYAPSAFPSPFVKLDADDEPANCRLGPEHQAEIPPLQEANAAPAPALHRRWVPEQARRQVKTYLAVVHCLQLAIGNVVYVWNAKSKEQIPAVLQEYVARDGQFRVTYVDGTGAASLVDADMVRGLVGPDEVLFALHDAGYDPSTALARVTQLVSDRSMLLVKEYLDDEESSESDASSSTAAASPRQPTERQSVLHKQRLAKQRQSTAPPLKRSRKLD
ncbi:hypothetical protein ACHHYP_03660 [Achlya hypogyna]|uniref:BAH domain-containing protein n=1 Tax=Achlya hypogyna TaxID=1202772 RepID=A0A1V9Z3A5_ACHHY|nr:hypothetical protein ACHHYP_03660 [Achlya hypogyna]